MNISEELQQHVADSPHIEKVYFTADGHHHFNAYAKDGKLYSRIAPEGVEEARTDYEITQTLSREDILADAEPEEERETVKATDEQPESEKETSIEKPAAEFIPSADSPI